jgi:hypothetical protein
MLQATAVALMIGAWAFRLMAIKALERMARVEEAWRSAAPTGDLVVVSIYDLGDASYRKFRRSVDVANAHGTSLLARLPKGLELPRQWSSLVGTTRLDTAADVRLSEAREGCVSTGLQP